MKKCTPDLRNVLNLAIRGNIIFSEQDLDKVEEWIKTEKEIKKMEDEMRIL